MVLLAEDTRDWFESEPKLSLWTRVRFYVGTIDRVQVLYNLYYIYIYISRSVSRTPNLLLASGPLHWLQYIHCSGGLSLFLYSCTIRVPLLFIHWCAGLPSVELRKFGINHHELIIHHHSSFDDEQDAQRSFKSRSRKQERKSCNLRAYVLCFYNFDRLTDRTVERPLCSTTTTMQSNKNDQGSGGCCGGRRRPAAQVKESPRPIFFEPP